MDDSSIGPSGSFNGLVESRVDHDLACIVLEDLGNGLGGKKDTDQFLDGVHR